MIFFHIGSQSRTFGTVWQHRQVPPLITDKLSLLVNYSVKLTGTSREKCAGSTIPALKLGGSTALSSRPFRFAVCVLDTGRKFCVDMLVASGSNFSHFHNICIEMHKHVQHHLVSFNLIHHGLCLDIGHCSFFLDKGSFHWYQNICKDYMQIDATTYFGSISTPQKFQANLIRWVYTFFRNRNICYLVI